MTNDADGGQAAAHDDGDATPPAPPAPTSSPRDALRQWCRAAWMFEEDGEAHVEPLLAAWRAIGPTLHPGAPGDDVDVDAIARVCTAVGLQRIGASSWRVASDDVRRGAFPSGTHIGDALAYACVVALEAARLTMGALPSRAALQRAFTSPQEARAALQAVVDGGSARTLRLAPDARPHATPPRSALDGPLHVVVGAGAVRAYDMLSPYVRRLRVPLARVGRVGEHVDDDDVYRGLRLLQRTDEDTIEERRVADAHEGFVDDGRQLIIPGAHLHDDGVDRRVRTSIGALRKARTCIVGILRADDLGALLRSDVDVRRIDIVAAGCRTMRPAFVVDAATDHHVAISGPADTRSTLSLPSLLVAPHGLAVDAGAFACVQQVLRARADGIATPEPTLRVVQHDDDEAWSQAIIDVLQGAR